MDALDLTVPPKPTRSVAPMGGAGEDRTGDGGGLLGADARPPFVEIPHHRLEACRRRGAREVPAATRAFEAHPEVP